jgi:hypothetical protein
MNRTNKRSVGYLTSYKEDEATASPSLSTMDDGNSDNMTMDSVSSSAAQSAAFCFGVNEPANCLTRELNKMPMESREKVGQDLYGLTKAVPIGAECFEQMEVEIQKIKDKTVYDRAIKLSPEYVGNTAFRLMFLRATQGNAKTAAKRITKHFTTKLSLFGEDKLVKDIEITDLDEYDMESLLSGGFQVLPQKDIAGRSVLFGRYTSMRYREIKNMVRRQVCYTFIGCLD